MDREAEAFKELILAAKGGDSQAFGRLYEDWYTPVYRFILPRVTSREVAEDLTQDVFTKLFAYLPRFEIRAAHPLGFLFTMARNVVIDYHKKHKSVRLIDEETGEMPEIPDSTMPTPEKEASLSEDIQHLKQALPLLTEEQQDVLTLRVIEERSVRETAEVMGKSEEAVRQLHVRALKALRGHLIHYV